MNNNKNELSKGVGNKGEGFNNENNSDKSSEVNYNEGGRIKFGECVSDAPPIAPHGRNARLEGPRLQVITSDNSSD